MPKSKLPLIAGISFVGLILIAIIGVIIYFGFVAQTGLPGYGDESDLYYTDHIPGVCVINVRNPQGELDSFEIDVTVRTEGNQIIKMFDGTPELPISYESFYGENGCRSLGLTFTDYPGFWDLVRTGYIERMVDYCPFGVIDPTPYDGVDNYQCEGLCVPDLSICRDIDTLLRCRSDRNSIETIECELRCENGECLESDYNLFVETDQDSYALGDDVLVSGRFTRATTPETPVEGVLVTAQVRKNNAVLMELQEYTNELGEVEFEFEEVNSVGETEIRLSVTHQGRLYENSKIINFVGHLISFEVTTYSYTQYNTELITFTVEMRDAEGRYVYPEELSNIRGIATLTNGQVLETNVEFKGEGEYEISSVVTGTGRYVGKLSFEYEGTPHDSPTIEIDVEQIRISVDISEIVPVATLGEPNDYVVRLYDSIGNIIDPDDLFVQIEYPDGITTDEITFDEIERLEEGTYEFSYVFPQVELFTMDILADKEGYVRGSATASVAVSGEGGAYTAGPVWFRYLIWIIPIGVILFFVLAYVFYRIIRKRK